MTKRGGKRAYGRGDQIHFIVTEEFVDVANDFVAYCKSNSINTSGAMRAAIKDWLIKRKVDETRLQQLEHGTASLESIAEEYERKVLREV